MITNTKKIIQGQIQSIAFGGDGIIRHQGQVVFVPFTAPKDEVSVQITVDKKSFARGKIQEIIRPSSHRVEPHCPFFGRCGGCQLQHLNYEQQLTVKKTFVEDALRRIGKLSACVENTRGAKEQWQYRRHIRLHWQNGRLGYVRHDSPGLIEITHCPIFDENPEIFQQIRTVCVSLGRTEADISIYKAGQGYYVVLFDFLVASSRCHQVFIDAINKNSKIKGIMWKVNNVYFEVGECIIEFELDGLKLRHNPKVFVQAHAEQSAALYFKLRELVKNSDAKQVLDLYCGMGATSLLLAREGMKVLAIESNPESIRLARENEAVNGLSGITWHQGDVDELTPAIIEDFNPDTVVLNPPRTGLGEAVKKALLDFGAKNMFYISCMPATLARDLASFSEAYEVMHCQPYDMFPATTHVETMVHLRRK